MEEDLQNISNGLVEDLLQENIPLREAGEAKHPTFKIHQIVRQDMGSVQRLFKLHTWPQVVISTVELLGPLESATGYFLQHCFVASTSCCNFWGLALPHVMCNLLGSQLHLFDFMSSGIMISHQAFIVPPLDAWSFAKLLQWTSGIVLHGCSSARLEANGPGVKLRFLAGTQPAISTAEPFDKTRLPSRSQVILSYHPFADKTQRIRNHPKIRAQTKPG